MTTLEALRGARHVIRTPDRWAQGVIARDEDGKTLKTSMDMDAQSFCIIGAFSRSSGLDSSAYYDAADRLREALGVESLVWYNDSSPAATHADVMDAFDKAIRLEEARQRFAEKVGP